MKKFILSSAVLMLCSMPLIIYAQQGASTAQQGGSAAQQGASEKKPPESVNSGAQMIQSPLRGVDSIAGLFKLLAQFVIDLAYVVIAAFLLISGFKFIKAQGNPEELAKAKASFWYTIIGALIVIGMDTLISVFQTLLKQVAK